MSGFTNAILIFCCALCPFTSAHAQTQNDDLQFKTSLVPATGGWYSPASNFGGITIDVNPDVDRPVTVGQWQFQEGGESKTVFFQSDMQYGNDEDFRNTGVYATLESPTFTFAGRGDYSDPEYLGSGEPQLTGRSIRIEFHSSREATFIDNPGQADERQHSIVAAVRGLPLFAAEDYSGDWIAVARYVVGDSLLRTAELKLTLTAHSLGEIEIYGGDSATSPLPTPGPQSRVFSVECTELDGLNDPLSLDGCELFRAAAAECNPFTSVGDPSCAPGSEPNQRTLVWINPDETGSMANVTEGMDEVTFFYWTSSSFPRTFAAQDRIIIRTFGPALSHGEFLREIILFRLPGNFYPDDSP